MKKASANGQKLSYADSHSVVRLSSKRFEQSPYSDKYVNEKTVFGLYSNRFYPLTLGGDAIDDYWRLRQSVVLYDVPEKPLEISGPDAVNLLERVLTRRIDNLKGWRARYAIACSPQGGILMDGVVIRLAEDRFWYVIANGEFESWLLAFTEGLDVAVTDPGSRVLQIQGPKSTAVLSNAAADQHAGQLRYFHAGMFNLGGQEVLVSRTGWTGEMGFEIYSRPHIDHSALWDHLMASGRDHGMTYASAESMGIRRIEAGILDNGTDMDRGMTPFAAGLEAFVDFSKPDFVGRDALKQAERTCLLFGLVCDSVAPRAGLPVFQSDAQVGQVTTGDWSPTLNTGIGYVRFDDIDSVQGNWLGQKLILGDLDSGRHDCEIVPLPFYDRVKKIPRGLGSAELSQE
jgi:aminomethyltransferase